MNIRQEQVVQTLLCHRAPQECNLHARNFVDILPSHAIDGKDNKFSEKASNCDTKSCYVYETLWRLRFHVVSLVQLLYRLCAAKAGKKRI